jgi:hypothetical protein
MGRHIVTRQALHTDQDSAWWEPISTYIVRDLEIESHFFPRMYHNLPPSRPVTMSDGWLRF